MRPPLSRGALGILQGTLSDGHVNCLLGLGCLYSKPSLLKPTLGKPYLPPGEEFLGQFQKLLEGGGG